jgi:hypothetical protein
MSASKHAAFLMAHRFKRIIAVCAISAVGVAGAAVSHAESGQATGSPGASRPELSAAGGALRVIKGSLDENVKESVERMDRASGWREGRSRDLWGDGED